MQSLLEPTGEDKQQFDLNEFNFQDSPGKMGSKSNRSRKSDGSAHKRPSSIHQGNEFENITDKKMQGKSKSVNKMRAYKEKDPNTKQQNRSMSMEFDKNKEKGIGPMLGGDLSSIYIQEDQNSML